MFVLGIDPGLTRTGYGLVEQTPAELRAVSVGVFRTAKEAPVAERLRELYHDVVELLADYTVDAAAIEQVFVNRNVRTAAGVGRASGVVLLALAQAGVPVVEYSPSAVKMALTGFGAADKAQVQRVVQMRLGLRAVPRPADAADALAIAVCHVQSAGWQRRVHQADAVP